MCLRIREEARAKRIEERKLKIEKRKNMKMQLKVNFIEKDLFSKQEDKL